MELNLNNNPDNNQAAGNTASSRPQLTPNYEPKKSYSKKSLWKWILLYFVIGTLVYGAGYYWFSYNKGDYSYNKEQHQNNSQATKIQPDSFALTKAVTPPFLKNVSITADMRTDFHYDGDFIPANTWIDNIDYYTPSGSTEKFLSLSKVKDKKNFDYYESENGNEIFASQESHSYQGTPIFLTNPNQQYSLSYLGFKINDKRLISDFSVELGIDYNADYYDGAAKKESGFSIASLFGVQTAYACGPGLYLRNVGNSNLEFVQEADGVSWYKLKNPIAMYNLRLQYTDEDCSKMPSYCQDQADDPADCDKYWTCDYNAQIDNLTKGNLRMHIYYKANDKEGLLKLQVANVIVSDLKGTYYQTTIGQDFNHYYRAYLH